MYIYIFFKERAEFKRDLDIYTQSGAYKMRFMGVSSSSHSFTAAALPVRPHHHRRHRISSSVCARKSTANNNNNNDSRKKTTLKSLTTSTNEFRRRRRHGGASRLEKNFNALRDDDDLGALEDKNNFEEGEQPNGIDGMTLWFALGFVFDFMTPSSAECRKIIRAAAEQNRVVLKNVSQWRKLQWEKAAKEHVVLRNAHTPLPGCRGYRVCWQSSAQNGGECSHGDLLLIFVPSTRKYHREEDFRKGFDCGPPQSAREKEGEESENDDVEDEDEDEDEQKKKKKTTKKKKKSVVKSAKEVLDALDRISKVNEQLWYVRERILKNGEGIDVDALAESTKKSLGDKGGGVGAPSSSSSMSSPSSSSSSSKQKEDGDDDEDKRTEEENSNSGDEDDDDDSNIATMDKYGSPEQAWENGQGADAVSLWLRFNINFDFHGPAGFVNRSVVKVAAEEKGIQTSQCESWPKHTWIDVAERAGVTFKSSHAAISQCGRGWKLCWVDDDVNITMKGKRAVSSSAENTTSDDAEDSDSTSDERRRRRRGGDGTSSSHLDDASSGGVPQAFVWVPETAKYYTFGAALKNKRSKIAGVSVQDVAKAAVAAAKSQPPPPGLKAALLRDSDFLATLGRAASKETAEKKKEVSTPTEDEDASEETREEKLLAMAREASERMEDDENDDYENQRETVYPPGFDGADGDGGDTIDGTHISSEFYSRSAGYLSFVENDWTEEDAMRQMGLKNVPDYYSDEVLSSPDEEQEDFIEATTSERGGDEEEQKLPKPVTLFDFEQRDEQVAPLESPKTFPDRMAELEEQEQKQKQNVAIATRKTEHLDLWQKFPEDLPDTKQWELHRLAGVDYLVAKMEDGRLDFNEVMKVKRDEYTGRCTSKLERVDTSGQVKGNSLQPTHYAPIHWTEQHHELKEGWDETNPDPRALSTYTREWERTTKVYLVPKSGDDINATLDFTKPLILFTNGESSDDIFQVHDAISGARENPDGVLVVKKGELAVVPQTSVPGYEELIQNWEQEVNWSEEKKNFNEDFYREIDFDQDIGDETPEIDLI